MTPAPATVSVLRGAVLGLGMIGRHHARILQSLAGVEFLGAVDADGDRYGALRDPRLLVHSLDALLDRAVPDFAVIALPTDEHAPAAARLAAAGVHLLVEKPLAATTGEAVAIIEACRAAGVRGAVGHVERFNPALLELRRRVVGGQLGQTYLIATSRIGPFPARVRDVGVVKDLATHDLDLVRWLGDSEIELVAAQTSHRMERIHEDVVLVNGRLASGVVFNSMVDWLTPTKVRQTRVLGERGMLLADSVSDDLTFYENAHVASEWTHTQALRGVSEGDAVRYALARREPLLVELETFCGWVRGDDDAAVVTLEEGLETVACAEAVLASARRQEAVRVAA
jgi:UDP-N-acetylglucosamine 3-dehydrogenase